MDKKRDVPSIFHRMRVIQSYLGWHLPHHVKPRVAIEVGEHDPAGNSGSGRGPAHGVGITRFVSELKVHGLRWIKGYQT